MPFDAHKIARRLMDEALVAGIAPKDQDWLRDHTAGCGECRGYAELSGRVLRGLHSFSFEIDPGMNPRVQNAVATNLATRPRGPSAWRWLSIAAAVLILMAAPIYRSRQDRQRAAAERADALLMERVEARVSRAVPEAMEPLLGDGHGGMR